MWKLDLKRSIFFMKGLFEIPLLSWHNWVHQLYLPRVSIIFLKFYIRHENLDTKLHVLPLPKIIRVDNVWKQRALFETVNLIMIIRDNQAQRSQNWEQRLCNYQVQRVWVMHAINLLNKLLRTNLRKKSHDCFVYYRHQS